MLKHTHTHSHEYIWCSLYCITVTTFNNKKNHYTLIPVCSAFLKYAYHLVNMFFLFAMRAKKCMFGVCTARFGWKVEKRGASIYNSVEQTNRDRSFVFSHTLFLLHFNIIHRFLHLALTALVANVNYFDRSGSFSPFHTMLKWWSPADTHTHKHTPLHMNERCFYFNDNSLYNRMNKSCQFGKNYFNSFISLHWT